MKRKKVKWGIIFVSPFLIGLLVFRLIPFIYTFVLSFMDYSLMSGVKQFCGLSNYSRLLQDTTFYKTIGNTVKIWALNIVPRLVVAMLCAIIFAQSKVRGKYGFKMIFYFPNLVNAATIAVFASLMMGWENGYVNKILIRLGWIDQSINWLGTASTAQGIVAVILWWQWFGYAAILFTTGLLNVPMEYIEAATVDGASKWQQFWKISFPLIRPTVAYVFLTTLIGGLQNFEIPRVITDGLGAPGKSLLTMTMQMHILAFRSGQYGYGSTYAMGIFLFTALVAGASYRFINAGKEG